MAHVGRGLYRPSTWNFDLEDAARALSEATPGAWISHITAARLRNSCLPAWLSDFTELHLSKPKALSGARRKGIQGHRVLIGPREVEFVDGIWLSTRVGADSAPETFFRLAMLDAGLPGPELQLSLRPDDPRSPSADLAFRRRRVAIQYDGEHHLQEPQRHSDRRRDKAFEAAGWSVIIVDKADLDDDFTTAVKGIKRVLKKSAVDPAAASGFATA